MSEINNGENGTEAKNVIVILTSDDVVGLIMEWAKAYELPVWMERIACMDGKNCLYGWKE